MKYFLPPGETLKTTKFIHDIPMPDPSDPSGFDPSCDPDNPVCIKYEDVKYANYRIRNGIINTPCTYSKLSDSLKMKLFFKKDFLQCSGSFKERGARNILMVIKENPNITGVIAASAGNHALALAYHGSQLKIPVTVVMPTVAPFIKVNNCVKLGARVIVIGENINESKRYAMKLAEINKAFYVNGYDNPYILAGQGTIGLEIMEALPDLDVLIVPVGGGGLLSGICAAYSTQKRKPRIIAVESKRANGWTTSVKAGKVTYAKSQSTIADGLAVEYVGVNSFETCRHSNVEAIAIDEKYIAKGIIHILEYEKCVVEGAGASSYAALLSGKISGLEGKSVCCILSGGNIDTTVLSKVIERGLAFDGRLHRFEVIVPDKPGSIAAISNLLKDLNASIKDIRHERAWLVSEVSNVRLRFEIETVDQDHANVIKSVLCETYPAVFW